MGVQRTEPEVEVAEPGTQGYIQPLAVSPNTHTPGKALGRFLKARTGLRPGNRA